MLGQHKNMSILENTKNWELQNRSQFDPHAAQIFGHEAKCDQTYQTFFQV